MQLPLRATRAEINLTNLRYNLSLFRSYLPVKTRIMAVVKADAYGHGAVQVAKTALVGGADFLGVAFVEEGIALRDAGINASILVFENPSIEHVPLFFEYHLTPTIFTFAVAEMFSLEACKRQVLLSFHINIDTGMGRLGIYPANDAVDFLERLQLMAGIKAAGIYTHFATADEKDKTFAAKQLSGFKNLLAILHKRNICPPLRHAANSAAALVLPEAWLDMVRLGISMYGHYPSEEVAANIKNKVLLKPLLTLRSKISFIKEVTPKTTISYGSAYVTTETSRIASVPAGYADGYNRFFSNQGEVLIKGKRAPIVGRVCMDQFLVKINHIPEAKAGDEVIIYGSQGEEKITVEEIATTLNTINYEILCSIGKRVPRSYTTEAN